MKEFIERNKPVLGIALVTLVLFVGIIVLSQGRTPTSPDLVETDTSELIASHTGTKGNPHAQTVLVEFSDFECPYCKAIEPTIQQLVAKYPNDLYFAYRHYPLSQHLGARPAAIASQAALRQGQDKFWLYVEKLFANQPNFSEEELVKYAQEIGLDMDKFNADFKSSDVADEVAKDFALASKLKLGGTPTFYLDGKLLQLTSLDGLTTQVEKAINDKGPTAVNFEELPTTETTPQATPTPTTTPEPTTLPEVMIEYTSNGFSPKNARTVLDQTVTWKNSTNADIVIEQSVFTYEELKQPVTIAAGQTFSLKMTKEKLWTFKEKNSGLIGSILTTK